MNKKSVSERFWEKVHKRDDDECWEWTACLNGHGYGYFSVGGKNIGASKYSLEEKIGRKLTAGELALHLCDNRKCVNPNHLYAGSPKDNVDDMLERTGINGQKFRTARQVKTTDYDGKIAKAQTLLCEGKRPEYVSYSCGLDISVVREMANEYFMPEYRA